MMSNVTERYLAMVNAIENREEGQGLVEYALIIALVSVILVGALSALQVGIGTAFSNITSSL